MSEAARDAEELGAPAEVVAQLEEKTEDKGFGVWRQNWDALQAFLAVASQWRTCAMATGQVYWQGLDYAAARAGLDLAGIEPTPAIWDDVRVMEREARDALNGVRG